MFDNPLQMILLGMGALVTGFVVLRSAKKLQQSRGRDLLSESNKEMIRAEQTVQSRIQKMEVRLLEYQREVEGQINTRMETLGQLMLRAEKQINRLEELLGQAENSGLTESVGEIRIEKIRIIQELRTAGFSEEEIAKIVQCSLQELKTLSKEESPEANSAERRNVA